MQHYEYTAFGKTRLRKEAQAFPVTNRYTGQKIDEDTNLYFYGSRYYDPELARFIQADTIVPSSTTSQALNRYTYVNNNPLKFTDPTGHGWFSDFFKKFIGTIITVALCFIAPWGSGFWSTLSYAAIGSGVSTAVNGGTFASFAIGMGIGLAAGYVAGALGLSNSAGTMWDKFIKDPIGTIFAGAVGGAVGGAISSAVYGQNIWKGMGEGALGGAIGIGVALGTETAIACGQSVIEDLADFCSLETGFGSSAWLTIKTTGSKEPYSVRIHSVLDLNSELYKVWKSGQKIEFFEFVGHGLGESWKKGIYLDQRGDGLVIGEGTLMKGITYGQLGKPGLNMGYYGIENMKNLITRVFAPNALIELEGCYTAYGNDSIAHAFKTILISAHVWGYTTKAYPDLSGIETWPKTKNRWIEVK